MRNAGLALMLAAGMACGGGEKPPPAAVATAAPAIPTSPTPPPLPEPLPPSGYKMEWVASTVPPRMAPGATVPVAVIVKNLSDTKWMNFANSPKGRHAVRLGYRWWKPGDTTTPVIDYPRQRGEMLAPLPPGESATIAIPVVAPPKAGQYILQLEMVQELINWFSLRGAPKLMVPVTVQ
jgi:hypothetical protein